MAAMCLRRRIEDGAPGDWLPRRGRARVLVEEADPAVGWATERVLEREGYDVAVCGGPAVIGRCPLVEDGACPLAEGADVVLNDLSLARVDDREVLVAIKARLPQTPLLVEAPRPRAARNAEVLAGCRLLASPVTAEMIRREVARALG